MWMLFLPDLSEIYFLNYCHWNLVMVVCGVGVELVLFSFISLEYTGNAYFLHET